MPNSLIATGQTQEGSWAVITAEGSGGAGVGPNNGTWCWLVKVRDLLKDGRVLLGAKMFCARSIPNTDCPVVVSCSTFPGWGSPLCSLCTIEQRSSGGNVNKCLCRLVVSALPGVSAPYTTSLDGWLSFNQWIHGFSEFLIHWFLLHLPNTSCLLFY
jgi:hypothetical protein